MTKLLPLGLIVMIAVFIVLGCGGGGSSSGGGGCTDCGTTYSPIRATVVDGSGQFVDPANLKPNSNYQLEIIGFDSSSGMHVLSGTWSTTAPASVATVTSTGTLTTVSAGTTSYTVSGTYSGTTYALTLGVWNNLATVTGKIRTTGGVSVGGAVVEFYNSGGQMVGSTRSNVSGTFTSDVPMTAKTFSVNLIDLTGFYDIFSYNGGDFSHGTQGCRANLPTLTANASVSLVADVTLQKESSSPPPPPAGCFTS